jgi:hypothetical protein
MSAEEVQKALERGQTSRLHEVGQINLYIHLGATLRSETLDAAAACPKSKPCWLSCLKVNRLPEIARVEPQTTNKWFGDIGG